VSIVSPTKRRVASEAGQRIGGILDGKYGGRMSETGGTNSSHGLDFI